jgi:tryptophan-rich sensory protein
MSASSPLPLSRSTPAQDLFPSAVRQRSAPVAAPAASSYGAVDSVLNNSMITYAILTVIVAAVIIYAARCRKDVLDSIKTQCWVDKGCTTGVILLAILALTAYVTSLASNAADRQGKMILLATFVVVGGLLALATYLFFHCRKYCVAFYVLLVTTLVTIWHGWCVMKVSQNLSYAILPLIILTAWLTYSAWTVTSCNKDGDGKRVHHREEGYGKDNKKDGYDRHESVGYGKDNKKDGYDRHESAGYGKRQSKDAYVKQKNDEYEVKASTPKPAYKPEAQSDSDSHHEKESPAY